MLLEFPKRRRRRHAPTSDSAGYKSGRNSDRETPVSRSIGITNSAGTPLLERVSQYQTCDCVVPIRSAKGFCPPTALQARLSASRDMAAEYRRFGESQPKSLCQTAYRQFSKFGAMGGHRFPDLAARVAHRMEKLGLSQGDVAARVREEGGPPTTRQQTIESILAGKSKVPRILLELARALETTGDWLKDERGPEENPDYATRRKRLEEAKRKVLEELPNTDDMGIFPEIYRLMQERRRKRA